MNKSNRTKLAAVIDIGSSTATLTICEHRHNAALRTIDTLQQPISLGHESFHQGSIRYETITALCEILSNYQQVLREYKVDACTVLATSAMRDAENRDFVVDQIKVKTGIDVLICDDAQEKSMIYYEVLRAIESVDPDFFHHKRTLISHLGTGSIGLSIYEKGAVQFSQNISTGSLKIHDMLSDTTLTNAALYDAAKEFLDVTLDNVVMPYPEKSIDCLVMTGTEVDFIGSLCNAKPKNRIYTISGKDMESLLHSIQKSSAAQFSQRYGISEARAESLYSSLAIFCRFLRMTHADQVLLPQIQLQDAFFGQMLQKNWVKTYEDFVSQNAAACANTFAKRFSCDIAHSAYVADSACLLFEKFRRAHGFQNPHKVSLQIASLLHECGYAINAKGGCSADLIRNIDICGLGSAQMAFAAGIVDFDESLPPSFDLLHSGILPREELLICYKLAVIFRLANALDKSKQQKIRNLRFRLREDALLISGVSDDALHLEQWAFQQCAPSFKSTFGIQPILQIKSTML